MKLKDGRTIMTFFMMTEKVTGIAVTGYTVDQLSLENGGFE